MKTLLTLATAAMLATSAAAQVDPAVLKAQEQRTKVVNKAAPAVVAIFAPGGRGGGSGVLISKDGFALSNFHVTKKTPFMKCGLNDGKLYDAVLVGIDPTGDVALIKLLGRNDFPFAPMGDSDKVEVGDYSYAMGNPFLLANDFTPTVTYGVVSGTHRYQEPTGGFFLEYTDCIQIDTSINPGNSGGPLFNEAGEIIGINGRGSFEKRGRVNSGAGYAISINQIKHFMGHLKSGRIVDHATLGATVWTVEDGSVEVNGILESSEAFRKGLREGDKIISFAGRPIRSVNQFKNILGIYPKGWTIPLTYRREGKTSKIFVKLQPLHRKSELIGEEKPKPKPGEPPKPGEKPKPGPKPIPIPRPGGGAAMPAKYKHMFKKKTGFANYYFNELEQKKLLKAVGGWGKFKAGTWKLEGINDGGGKFAFRMNDKAADLNYEGKKFFQPIAGAVDLDIKPPGTGGLIIATHHLRRMLTDHKAFTEFYYLGTEPLDGKGPLVDVLIGVRGSAEARFFFDRDKGTFLGFDTQVISTVAECQVRFSDVKKFGDVSFPSTWTIRHAGKQFAKLTFQKVETGGTDKVEK